MADTVEDGSESQLPPGLQSLDTPAFVLTADGMIHDYNDSFADLVGESDQSAPLTATTVFTATGRSVQTVIDQTINTGSETAFFDIDTVGEEIDRVECQFSRLPTERAESSAVLALCTNVETVDTDRERALEHLQDATEGIQRAETATDVARIAVQTVSDTFGLPYAVCWFHDEESSTLVPGYATEHAHREGLVGSFGTDSFEYGVFESGEPSSYTPRAVSEENSLENAILFPLGKNGMIGVGASQKIDFEVPVIDVIRTLAKHTATALERVERTAQLREEQALTESIFSTIPDVFYAFDEHGNFFRWNDRLSEVTGYSDEEISSMHPAELFPPEEQERIYEVIAEVFEHGRAVTLEAPFETADGERIPFEFTGAKLTDETGDTLGIVGVGRDISERKQRQRRFEAVFNNTYQFTGLMEPDGTLIEVNNAALEFGALDSEAVVGKKLWEAYWFDYGDDAKEQAKQAVERAAAGEFIREEVTVRGSNREAVIDFSVRPITDEDGEITLLVPEGRDITELKERERELRRERDHIRRTEAQADVGGWEIDLDAESLYWTDGLRELYDAAPDFEPKYEDLLSYFHPDSRDQVASAFASCEQSGEPFDIEVQLVTADGRTRWVQVEGDRVTVDGTALIRGVTSDITERKQREQRLMVLNRVLRHNLRNKLTVVSGYADHIDSTLEAFDGESDGDEKPPQQSSLSIAELRDSTDHIKASSDNLVEIAEKIQQFDDALDRVDPTDTVDIKPVLDRLVSEYADNEPAATIRTDIEDVRIKGNEKSLRLIIGELIDNAIEHSERSDPSIELTAIAATNEQVAIRVTDDGPGIPEMEQNVLAEGEESSLLHGSGIGLWTINWLVTRLGGHISIDDNEPTGTVVTITVPRVIGE